MAKLFSTLYSGDYLTSTDEKQKVKKEEHEDKEEEVITAETDEVEFSKYSHSSSLIFSLY